MNKQRPTAAEIEIWIAEQIAQHLSISPDEIDPREPFARYGLDSMAAVTLAGDLEEWLNRKLPATITWDYPTIQALSAHLAETAPGA